MQPDRILIVKLSSLGDVVNVTPCFRALRHHFPQAELTLAVDAPYVPLVESCPHLDHILVAPPWTGSRFHRLFQIRRAFGDRRFDLALDLQGSLRSAAWVYLSRARWKAGRGGWRPFWQFSLAWDGTQHAVDNNAIVLERLGIPVSERSPQLFVPPWAQTSLNCILRSHGLPPEGMLLLAPFSRWASKAWPVDHVRTLLAWCHRQGIGPVVLLGGADDPGHFSSDHVVSLVGKLRLEETMALCTRAALMVTVDSGPMHVAAALGTPLVALFGPTWPEHSGPWGQLDAVIQSHRPSFHHAYRNEADTAPMRGIEVEQVGQAITAQWTRRAKAV